MQVVQALGLKPGDFVGLTAGKKAGSSEDCRRCCARCLGTYCRGSYDEGVLRVLLDRRLPDVRDWRGVRRAGILPQSVLHAPGRHGSDLEDARIRWTIYAYQYDLVCNGVELSSGAVRNHDPEIMVKAFELVGLGEDDVKAKFPAMYNAFCYGAPPHAGIAPGVDRMVMLLAGEESIREIIPFPMNKTAQDVMMGAPATVDPKQLADVHIAIVKDEKEGK